MSRYNFTKIGLPEYSTDGIDLTEFWRLYRAIEHYRPFSSKIHHTLLAVKLYRGNYTDPRWDEFKTKIIEAYESQKK
jgi:hypothetical protein